jgi:hypothetical protein
MNLNCIFYGILFFSVPIFAQETNNLPSTDTQIEAEYKRRITLEKINGVYIPKNLDDVYTTLDKMVDAESKFKVKMLPESKVDSVLSPRLGLWMSLNWSFYEGSRISHYLHSAGVTYPEDMASFLLIAWHKHLNGKPVEIKNLAVGFRDKRRKQWAEEVEIAKKKAEKTKN